MVWCRCLCRSVAAGCWDSQLLSEKGAQILAERLVLSVLPCIRSTLEHGCAAQGNNPAAFRGERRCTSPSAISCTPTSLLFAPNAVGQVNERVGTFEQNVTHQFAETFQRLARVEHETEHTKEKVAVVENQMENLAARVTRLEQAGPADGPTQGLDTRPPALIIGGWHPDTEADKVIDHANKLVAELRLDLDMRGTFVPGVRQGYAIIPLTRKDGETQEDQRTRVQHCIRQVAAKCKRLLMELGALSSDVETEYATGQVWFKPKKVASATNHMAPQGTTQTGSEGWIDLQTIANKLHRSLEAVQTAWQPLGAILK
ncbi:unnamed protein product [Symbiodinium microadriaticum]|nr:unnamed protein product [Symbiodinium microadriaticum]